MAVQVNVTVDLSQAMRDLTAFQSTMAASLTASANQSQIAFQNMATQVTTDIQRLTAQMTTNINASIASTQTALAALRASMAAPLPPLPVPPVPPPLPPPPPPPLGSAISMLVLENIVDKFGDVKDIFEKTGTALFGLSEETVEAGVRIGDLAEKGASLGAMFGPLGAAIGLVAGGALGFFVEKINESNKIAEEAAVRVAEYQQRVETLRVAASVAVSQEELNNAIKDGQILYQQNAATVKILADGQAAASKRVEETQSKIAGYQAELDKLNQTLAQENSLLDEATAKSRANVLTYDIQIAGAANLEAAKKELTIATNALIIAEKEQQKVALSLAQAQAIQAIDTLDAARAIEEQLLIITKGSKFATQDTKTLQAEQERLTKTLNISVKELESLGLANIELADSQYNVIEATQSQNENDEQANIIKSRAKGDLAKLSEITAELKTRKIEEAGATKTSSSATKEDTKAKEDNAKATQAQIKALFDAESIADKLASKTKLAEDAFVIEPKLKIPPLDKEDILLALPSLDFASFVDITKYIEQFEDFAVEIQDIFREQFEEKALNLSVAVDPESQKQAEKDLQDVIRNAEQVEKQRQERADYASKLANERRQKETEDALSQAEQLLRPLEGVTMSIFDTMLENVALGKSAFADLGVAIRDSIFESLKAIGKEYAVKAIGETAQGLAALAIGGPFGAKSASEHFAAAANFAAAAVAAGVGAAAVGAGSKAAISGGGGGGGSASLGGAGGGGSPSLGAAASGASNQPTAAVVVDFRGAMFPTSDLRAAQEFGAAVAGYIDSAYKGGAISSRPRVGR